jgi:hypothetical protein
MLAAYIENDYIDLALASSAIHQKLAWFRYGFVVVAYLNAEPIALRSWDSSGLAILYGDTSLMPRTHRTECGKELLFLITNVSSL